MSHLGQDEIWDDEAAAGYDTPGTGMFAPEVLGPTVDRLAALADGGRALELAIGTGRVAVPLAARGVPVTGIELSAPMVARLREKADEAAIPVVMGDMATARAEGSFRLVYLVFNTISNLLTQDEQVACFANAARHLEPGAGSSSSCGCPSCAGCHPACRRPWASARTATSSSTPTTCCASTSSPTTSPSTRPAAGRPASGGPRTATSGRASWT